MAIESVIKVIFQLQTKHILQNRYTNKSDVWSFAITLWEIFEFAVTIPYADWSNADVLNNIERVSNDDVDTV
jgi:discoidin domain receptor family protein 2